MSRFHIRYMRPGRVTLKEQMDAIIKRKHLTGTEVLVLFSGGFAVGFVLSVLKGRLCR